MQFWLWEKKMVASIEQLWIYKEMYEVQEKLGKRKIAQVQ